MLPPGLFVTAALLLALAFKKARVPLILTAMLIYIFSTRIFGTFLLAPLEMPYNHPHTPQNVDAVIILSGGSYGEKGNLTVGESTLKRLLYGTIIAKKENLPILFSGAGRKTYSETDAMRETISLMNTHLDINLSTKATFTPNQFGLYIEDKSLDTYENAAFTKTFFKQQDITLPKIYLVTSAFHMRRAVTLYEHFGFEVIPVATDFMATEEMMANAFLPTFSGLKFTYFALHEYAGLLLLALKLK